LARSAGSSAGVGGVLLDVDGVLTRSWKPLPGAREAVAWLRSEGVPFRLVTNTTVLSARGLAEALRRAGFDVRAEELVTPPVAAVRYLLRHHPGARVFLLGRPDSVEDLSGIDLAEVRADVVLVAGADEAFTWTNLNRALQMVVSGAALVAMHRNVTWLTEQGLVLDAGAYVLGLERAAGVEAVVIGKPSPDFFRQGLDSLGLPPERVAMVGDDLENDVLAAQGLGMTGVWVRTSKAAAIDRPGEPDRVIDSAADLPGLLTRMRS
jgi:HAD superfamily hydrolase (TIGR01458 family)